MLSRPRVKNPNDQTCNTMQSIRTIKYKKLKMSDLELVLAIIIILLLWDKYRKRDRITRTVHHERIAKRSGNVSRRDGLHRKPTAAETKRMAQQTISFKELFDQSQLANAKRVMPWLDPVVYEDLRMLNVQGLFTRDQIEGIIAKS